VLALKWQRMKQFGWIHELAFRSESGIRAAELLNWRAQKLKLYLASGAQPGRGRNE
jgi:hypothetical protein